MMKDDDWSVNTPERGVQCPAWKLYKVFSYVLATFAVISPKSQRERESYHSQR